MKIRVRNYFLIGVVLLSLILLTGCGTLERLVKKDGTSTPLADWIGVSGDPKTALPASATTAGEGKVIALYFPDLSGKYLLKEERMLPKTVSIARETVNQWLKGPTLGTMQGPVSTAATLLDIAIKDTVIIVDLSKDFLQSNSKVSPEVALYGLVNTLTQFSTVNQVQIRIEGKPLTKYGTVDATRLVYKANLVKGAVSEQPTVPNNGAGNPGLGIVVPSTKSNGALPDSPSSINLFNYPPSST